MENENERLNKLVNEYDRQFKLIQEGDTGQDTKNRLVMDLLAARKETIKLQKDLKEERDARSRYGSPENRIVEWAEAVATGELDGVIKHYAENNYHRKRFESGGSQRDELAKEFEELCAYDIEPEVISITMNPQEGTATAKLTLKLTLDGATLLVRASMVLVREFTGWRILDEGF
jgi:hypothetical protein